MAVDTQTAAELTQEQVSTILTAPLEQASLFIAAGPSIFDTNGSPIRVPFLPRATELEFVGENELIPEATPDTDETVLLPNTMKSVKTITRYSNELARQSVVSIDAVLQQRLVADVASAIDRQLFGDTGDGIEIPQGMFAWDGVGEVDAAGALTIDSLLSAQGVAFGSHVDYSKLRLVIRPEDYMALRAAKDGDQRYMLTPDATVGGLPPILGMQPIVTDRVPVGSAAVADFSQIALARDLAPSVKILVERYADYDQQAIRVVARYDAKPLNPEAVTVINGITGAA